MAQTLPQRALGKSGINSSAIGLGCMSFSGTYGPSDDAAAIALIHDALDAGITMLDSSDAYGKGQNETLVGKRSRAGAPASCSPPSSATSAAPAANTPTAGRSS